MFPRGYPYEFSPLYSLQACRPCILWRSTQFVRLTFYSQAFGMSPLHSSIRTAWTCNRRALSSWQIRSSLGLLIQPDLVVFGEGVHETQQLVPSCWVYEEVNTREWVAVLGARFVQVSEVYTHPPLAIRFFDHHYIGQPFRIIYLSNEICF